MISGEISPPLSNQSVVMYVGREGLAFTTYKTVTTQFGKYSFVWNATQTGAHYITTSWSGTSNYAGSDSETLTVFIESYEAMYGNNGGSQDASARSIPPYSAFFNQAAKKVLKSNVTGTGVSLTGEFIVLNGNQTEPSMVEQKIPRVERIIYFPRTRQSIRVVVSDEMTVIEPVENKQLGFILRQDSEDNYSASVEVLADQQISQITRIIQENKDAAFMNASEVARENTWYKIEATISKNSTEARLYEMNNTLLENTAPADALRVGEMGILMAYRPNAIIAFKNLKVETLDTREPALPDNAVQPESNEFEWLPYIAGVALLSSVALTVGFVRRRRKNRGKESGER